MTNHLDTFETQLLEELRAVVASQPQNAQSSPHGIAGRRRGVLAVVATAAAATVAVLVVTGTFADPAYAVGDGPRGTIKVSVNRLEDAAGLERALAKHGVKADVRYLGFKKECDWEDYTPATSVKGSDTLFSVGSNGISMTLDRRDVSHGETVVIAASNVPRGVWGNVGIATGKVGDCRPVPWTPPQGYGTS